MVWRRLDDGGGALLDHAVQRVRRDGHRQRHLLRVLALLLLALVLLALLILALLMLALVVVAFLCCDVSRDVAASNDVVVMAHNDSRNSWRTTRRTG